MPGYFQISRKTKLKIINKFTVYQYAPFSSFLVFSYKYYLEMHIENILFLDIETVSQTKSHALLDEEGKLYWRRKAKMMIPLDRRESDDAYVEAYHDKAGIFAEFGKIICISVGIIHKTDGVNHLRIKSFAGDDESLVLEGFFDLVRAKFNDSNKSGFCGHNIREFDIPYICRRAIINGLLLPATLDLRNRKPWEIKHLYDTLEMWKFGDIIFWTFHHPRTILMDLWWVMYTGKSKTSSASLPTARKMSQQ